MLSFATRCSTFRSTFTAAAWYRQSQQRIITTRPLQMIHSSQRIWPLKRPPDPSSFNDINSNNNNNSTDTTDNNITPKNELTYVQTQSLRLQNWLQTKHSILVITGAGMSTASGIPDYRGANGSYFTGHKPIIHHDFMRNESSRKRYWARSLVGYSPFSDARPNVGHLALARMEELGLIGVCLEKNRKNNKNDDAAAGGGGDRVVLEDELFERLSDSCYGPAMITATTTTTGSSSFDNNRQQKTECQKNISITKNFRKRQRKRR